MNLLKLESRFLRRVTLLAVFGCLTMFGCASEEDDPEVVGSSEAGLTTDETKATAAALGLKKDHRCGDAMGSFRPAPEMRSRRVFTGDRPWHKWNPCLEDLREAAKRQATSAEIYPTLHYQVLYILNDASVRFYGSGSGRLPLSKVTNKNGALDFGKFDRVVETNDNGLAYSTMDQTDLGGALLELHKLYVSVGLRTAPEATAYKALGLGTLRVVTDTVDKGGLRSTKRCEKNTALKCSWFHAQTRTDATNTKEGGTLNKHLYGVRDLYQAGNILRDLGDAGAAAEFRSVAMEGMNQMAYSASATEDGDLPALDDYIPRRQGKPIQNSWLYYGRNIVEGKPYFLDEKDYKNCNYHLLVLRLLNGNLRYMQAEHLDTSGFTRARSDLDGASVLGFVLKTYDKRLALGLYKDAPTEEGGNFDKCSRENTTELDESSLDVVRRLL